MKYSGSADKGMDKAQQRKIVCTALYVMPTDLPPWLVTDLPCLRSAQIAPWWLACDGWMNVMVRSDCAVVTGTHIAISMSIYDLFVRIWHACPDRFFKFLKLSQVSGGTTGTTRDLQKHLDTGMLILSNQIIFHWNYCLWVFLIIRFPFLWS